MKSFLQKQILYVFFMSILIVPFVSGCSVNPATGRSQFAAFMSPQQELQVGAQEHQKIEKQFGFYDNSKITKYVQEIGARISKNTERSDVRYQFFVLDSPIVNAFALPGGYVYVSRGLITLANSEAELAAVLAHEVAHITARHSAERYSRGVATSLGAGILSAVLDSSGATQALGLGADLYLKSYSREQENESDTLGLRYMTQGGYDPAAMSSFLQSLQNQSALDQRLEGKDGRAQFSYFSTHPATKDRVFKTRTEAKQYTQGANIVNRDKYLNQIDGMVYSDSAKHGFIRGQSFLHPVLGFGFEVPDGFRLINQPTQVIATSKSGAVILFDLAKNTGNTDPLTYLIQNWMKNEPVRGVESITVNGMPAATATFAGQINGRPTSIRIVAIQWSGNRFARFQIAIPQGSLAEEVESLKRATYSFRNLSAAEKAKLKPQSVQIVTAKSGDTANSLARKQPFSRLHEERFRVLNGLGSQQNLIVGEKYKLIQE